MSKSNEALSKKILEMMDSMNSVRSFLVDEVVKFGLKELEKLNFDAIVRTQLDFRDVVNNTSFYDIGYVYEDRSIGERMSDKIYGFLDENPNAVFCLAGKVNIENKHVADRSVDYIYEEVKEELEDLFDDLVRHEKSKPGSFYA